MNKKLYILLLAIVAMVWSATAQNEGVEPPTSSAMNHLYPSPERWSGASYSEPKPSYGERLYLLLGGSSFLRRDSNNSMEKSGWGVSGRVALGYNISPVHSVELGASLLFPIQDGVGDHFAEIDASYLFNVTAFASKSETPSRWELFLKAGVNTAFLQEQFTMGFNTALRLKYNISSAIGVYVEPAMAINAYAKNNTYQSPYMRGDVMPSISIGLSIRPSTIVNSIQGVLDRRNDRLDLQGYDVKPLFAIKTNLLYDIASVVNVGIEIPIRSHYSVDVDLLFPWWVWDDGTEDSRRDRFILVNGNIEGKYWFGDRSRRSVLTGWYAGLYTGGGLYDIEIDGEGDQGEFIILGGVSGGYAHTVNRSGSLRLEYSLGASYIKSDYKKYQALYSTDSNWHAVESSNGVYRWLGPAKAEVSLAWLISYKKMKGGRR